MTDNFASHPFAAQLTEAGVPLEIWPMLTSHGVGTLGPKLGIHFEELTVERVVATMPVQGNQQVVGILHGGATAALAETLGSFAAAIHTQGRKNPVGVDLNITHHRGASSGVVRGICTPLHLGRSSTSHQIEVFDEAGKRIATARITNQLLDPR
ncbi:hotdog fold thioesterase [Galactobacter caseinivorans]|uniref:Hotdog fold thioesterase n=1 Tax=Galactobacter caseinivorans TaxID=2676123 RepID=A0A496PKK3_9MICC|nr:hotdog fold thioesterase [Galactobacter caseinivorans]RKW71036.1 hotdog fold thioesterase [Galactobacter caseinivorans]